tara:strand:- start:251 stop:394 length:144 start_codon:yes stop_codon:yes gene_type:complete
MRLKLQTFGMNVSIVSVKLGPKLQTFGVKRGLQIWRERWRKRTAGPR